LCNLLNDGAASVVKVLYTNNCMVQMNKNMEEVLRADVHSKLIAGRGGGGGELLESGKKDHIYSK
jgi:hypothetical protein